MKISSISKQNQSFKAVRVPLTYEKLNKEKYMDLFYKMAQAKNIGKLKFGQAINGEKVAYFTQFRYGSNAEDKFVKEISKVANNVSSVPMKEVNADVRRDKREYLNLLNPVKEPHSKVFVI